MINHPQLKMYKVLFFVSILVHVFFYISSHLTHTLDIFFENVTRGQDFFQIPNGAYSFINGATLEGTKDEPRYINCCGVNQNVYHPLFTLLIGVPLQLFKPWTAFAVWVGVHLIITLTIILVLFKTFGKNKYVYLASSLYLFNSYNYYEIKHAQYHALLGFFIFLMIISLEKKRQFLSGIFYYLTLLVKPIGLLWFIPLLIYRKYKVAVLGGFLFLISTIAFVTKPWGSYYWTNMLSVMNHTRPTYNIAALSVLFPIEPMFFHSLAKVFAVFLVGFQIVRRPNLVSLISAWIIFQLIFYVLVFEYHYSIIAIIIPLLILTKALKKTLLFWLSAIMLTLPTPVIILRLTGSPAILPPAEYSMTAVWSIFWLALLLTTILIYSTKVSDHEVGA